MKNKIFFISIVLILGMVASFSANKKNVLNKNITVENQISTNDSVTKEIDSEESLKEAEEKLKKEDEKIQNIKQIIKPGYESIDKFLKEESSFGRFQGVALVAKGDEVKFAKAYGYADYEKKIENTLTTRFAIASNTKQITAAAIMQLVEDGKLELSQTIEKFFPKYKYAKFITIRDLVQMRSGIPDYLNDIALFMKDDESRSILKKYENESYFDKYVQDDSWSKDIILNNLYLSELLFKPGSDYNYSNTNYYLLGLIIENITNLSFEEYVDRNIFKLCDMTTSSMTRNDNDAVGHGSYESGEIIFNPEFVYSAGNIYANVFDLLRWNRKFHKGEVVSKSSYVRMTSPIDKYGYGLFIENNIIRHSGVIDGFNSNIEYEPSTDTTIIVLENSSKITDVLDAKYDTDIIRKLTKKIR